jgi:hypothetical protein
VNLWKVIVATLAIFITGVVTGGLLVGYTDRAAQRNRRPAAQREISRPLPNSPGAGTFNPRDPQTRPLPNTLPNRLSRAISIEFLQKLDSEVHLTSGQRERIEQVIADGQLRNKQIWDRVAPEIRRENLETQRRVRDILTPEQLARFDELMKQSRPNVRRNEDSAQPGQRPRDPQRRPGPQREEPETPSPPPANP